jgi:hypothetical protein
MTAILFRNVVAQGAIIAGSPPASDTMPEAYLLDPQPSLRAGFPGSEVSIVVDLGASYPIDVVALISTTLGDAATIRVRASASDSTGADGSAWDTGVLLAQTSDDASGNVILARPAAAPSDVGDELDLDFVFETYIAPAPLARFLRIDLVDSGAATIDVGRIAAGVLFRPSRRHAVGFREGRVILDRTDENEFTGARFPVRAIRNPRFVEWRLPLLTRAEALGPGRAMIAQLGGVEDALWIPDVGLPLSEINLRAIWGGMARQGDEPAIEQVSQGRFSRAARMVERP